MSEPQDVRCARVPSRVVRDIGEVLAAHLNTPPSVRFFHQVAALVARRMRILGENAEQYARRFSAEPPDVPASEAAKLARFIIPKVTNFFRYPEQFESLAQLLTVTGPSSGGSLHIWSAACATGEEPYSIAMVAREVVPEVRCQILATDIDREAIATAVAARYGEAALRVLGPRRLERWTLSAEPSSRVMTEEIRRCVRFLPHSLAEGPSPRPPDGDQWDVIFCRNVLMYLTEGVQREAACRILGALKPGGVLFLGPAEGLLIHDVDRAQSLVTLERNGDCLYYRKVRQDEPSAGALAVARGEPESTVGTAASECAASGAPAVSIGRALVRARLERVMGLADSGAWKEAVAAVREVLLSAPDSADAHLTLGILLARAGGNEPEAERALSRALQLGHRSGLLYFELGRLRERDAPEAAREAFSEALRLSGDQGGETLSFPGLSVSSRDVVVACKAKLRQIEATSARDGAWGTS